MNDKDRDEVMNIIEENLDLQMKIAKLKIINTRWKNFSIGLILGMIIINIIAMAL